MGVLFLVLQYYGFYQLWMKELTFQKTVSYSFLYVIAGLHALHVFAGVIALLVTTLKAYRSKLKSYNAVPVEIIATFWHFVDFLWIYLLIFLLMIR